MKVAAAAFALVPPGVVTVTATAPVPAGLVAVIWVGLTTVKLAAAAEPKLTAVAPVKPLPAIVTLVPPAAGPPFGVSAETAGGGGGTTYVYWSAELVGLTPTGVVTTTSTVPLPAGARARRRVPAALTLMIEATCPPNVTCVAPSRLLPKIATPFPPAVDPDVGLTPVTTGGPGGDGAT